MPKRVGPKASGRKMKKGWPSKTRSYAWRAGSARPALSLVGYVKAAKQPGNVHRFTRWSSLQTVQISDAGGGVPSLGITNDLGTSTAPVKVGNLLSANLTIAPNNYQYGGAMEFVLTDLPSSTDFTGLFDRYEIEQVDIEVVSTKNSADMAQVLGTEVMPTIIYTPDFDDSDLPTAPGEISVYQRAKQYTFRGSGKPLKFSIKPRVSIPVYTNGAGPQGYLPGPSNVALSSITGAIPHFGVKFWVSGHYWAIGTTTPGLQFRCKYHLKCTDSK